MKKKKFKKKFNKLLQPAKAAWDNDCELLHATIALMLEGVAKRENEDEARAKVVHDLASQQVRTLTHVERVVAITEKLKRESGTLTAAVADIAEHLFGHRRDVQMTKEFTKTGEIYELLRKSRDETLTDRANAQEVVTEEVAKTVASLELKVTALQLMVERHQEALLSSTSTVRGALQKAEERYYKQFGAEQKEQEKEISVAEGAYDIFAEGIQKELEKK